MLSRLLLAATAAAAAALAEGDQTIGATIDSQGVTRLYGNSFGCPGYNVTYDYIVSVNPLMHAEKQGALRTLSDP